MTKVASIDRDGTIEKSSSSFRKSAMLSVLKNSLNYPETSSASAQKIQDAYKKLSNESNAYKAASQTERETERFAKGSSSEKELFGYLFADSPTKNDLVNFASTEYSRKAAENISLKNPSANKVGSNEKNLVSQKVNYFEKLIAEKAKPKEQSRSRG